MPVYNVRLTDIDTVETKRYAGLRNVRNFKKLLIDWYISAILKINCRLLVENLWWAFILPEMFPFVLFFTVRFDYTIPPSYNFEPWDTEFNFQIKEILTGTAP